MEKVIYSNGGGLGLILHPEDQEQDYFEPREVTLVNETILPGQFTTLFDFFTRPIEYMGFLKGEKNCMVFKLGQNEDLFGSTIFYSCLYWLSEKRIVNKYKEGTARDFNWINNNWK